MERTTKKKVIIAVWATLLMVGCSPRAVVDMYTMEYAPTSADSVKVFSQGEQVPPHTLAIGEVSISAHALDYDRIMGLAIEKTALNGGNGLAVTDMRLPDLWKSYYRVRCTMLRIPQDMADSLAHVTPIPLERQQERSWERATSQQYHQQQQKAKQQRENQPTDILRVSIGPSLMTSDYQLGSHLYKSRCGLDLSLDYDHVWRSGFGFGINYRHDYTPFEEGLAMRTNYIGPSLVIAYPGNGIRCDMAVGFGYCWYAEHYKGHSMTEGHVAPLMRFGVEFAISEKTAIGLQMNMFSVHLDEPEGLELKKNEFYGIQRIGFQLGARFYL